MGDFSADWLALREAADDRARSRELAEALARWAGETPRLGPLSLLDLGAGSGSNLRYLAPLLGARQQWLCVDQDPELLAALLERTASWAGARGLVPTASAEGLTITGPGISWTVAIRGLDLAKGAAALPMEAGTLVVASALMDLVSEPWLRDLVGTCQRHVSPLLAALSYDGRVSLEPPEPLDGLVIALVNGHQGRDKGFGPALGPSATRTLPRLGRSLGCEIQTAQSDWELDPAATKIQEALMSGWAEAAREQIREATRASGDDIEPRMRSLDRWLDARLGHVAAGRSRLRVGHQDLLLLPPRHPAGT